VLVSGLSMLHDSKAFCNHLKSSRTVRPEHLVHAIMMLVNMSEHCCSIPAPHLLAAGMNSMMEGVGAGKPLFCLPYGADQYINAQHVSTNHGFVVRWS
jgi:hypothetical protein